MNWHEAFRFIQGISDTTFKNGGCKLSHKVVVSLFVCWSVNGRSMSFIPFFLSDTHCSTFIPTQTFGSFLCLFFREQFFKLTYKAIPEISVLIITFHIFSKFIDVVYDFLNVFRVRKFISHLLNCIFTGVIRVKAIHILIKIIIIYEIYKLFRKWFLTSCKGFYLLSYCIGKFLIVFDSVTIATYVCYGFIVIINFFKSVPNSSAVSFETKAYVIFLFRLNSQSFIS